MEKSMVAKLSPPWYSYHRKVQAMFGRDPEVRVKDLADIGDGKFSYIMHVYNKEKAEAIKAILPQEVEIGNIVINAAILGPDENSINCSEKSVTEIYDVAFAGNPIFEKTVTQSTYGESINYCIFKKEVIQFWNDDLSDYYGNYNGLPTDIARDILKPDDIQYCISVETN